MAKIVNVDARYGSINHVEEDQITSMLDPILSLRRAHSEIVDTVREKKDDGVTISERLLNYGRAWR
jgi:hypothetical protein